MSSVATGSARRICVIGNILEGHRPLKLQTWVNGILCGTYSLGTGPFELNIQTPADSVSGAKPRPAPLSAFTYVEFIDLERCGQGSLLDGADRIAMQSAELS